MKNIYIIPSLLLIIILFSSCSKTLLISQGEHGYAGELGENYEITTLNTVSSSGSSFFGFGSGAISEDGIVTNFFASGNLSQNPFSAHETTFAWLVSLFLDTLRPCVLFQPDGVVQLHSVEVQVQPFQLFGVPQ